MPITPLSDDALFARALAFVRNRLPNVDLSLNSYFGQDAQAKAALAAMVYSAVAAVDGESPPSSRSTTAALDAWALALGLPTGAAGVYGRKPAVVATGGVAPVTGQNGATATAGAQLTGPDGVTVFALRETVTIPGSPPGTGSVNGTFDAVSGGSAGNVPSGQRLTWISAPANIDATVTLSTNVGATVQGADREANEDVLKRILARLQTPPRGGSAQDYVAWAQSQVGIKTAFPYPHRGGVGTVHLIAVAGGTGTGRRPLAVDLQRVNDYINGDNGEEGQRPVPAQGFYAMSPYMVATGMVIRARVQLLSTAYNFDWDSSVASYTVNAYTVGPPDTLELNTLAPADLKAAIDGGKRPRLQVLSTTAGASSVPVLVRCTAYADAGGRTTLTLENPLPQGWVKPTVGDTVHAGGPVVEQTARAIQAYVDSLGPARGSYASAQIAWESDCRINRLIQIVLDQVDGNGNRFFKDIVAGGVTISYNGGAAAATDVTASDVTTNGPELLYARNVAVTP